MKFGVHPPKKWQHKQFRREICDLISHVPGVQQGIVQQKTVANNIISARDYLIQVNFSPQTPQNMTGVLNHQKINFVQKLIFLAPRNDVP